MHFFTMNLKTNVAAHVCIAILLLICKQREQVASPTGFASSKGYVPNDSLHNAFSGLNNSSVKIEEFDVQIFNGLLHFDEAKFYEEHLHVTKHLANVIDKHGFHAKVTVQLLHKHFDLELDEILAETIHGNESIILPTSKNVPQDRVAYMWLFSSAENERVILHPLEYLMNPEKEVLAAYESMMEATDFLMEFAATLESFQVSDVFGIALQHRNHIVGNTLETQLHDDCQLRGLKVQSMVERSEDMTSVCFHGAREEDC